MSNSILASKTVPFKTQLLLVILFTGIKLLYQWVSHKTLSTDYSFSIGPILTTAFVNNAAWLIWIPTFQKLIRNLNINKSISWLPKIAVFFAATLVHRLIVFLSLSSIYFLQSSHFRSPLSPNSVTELSSGLFISMAEGFLIVGILMVYHYQIQLKNKERDLARAQLQALQMQLHPHFLFNTLHSISSMIDIDPRKAQKMISKVGDLFRTLLKHEQHQLVTLQEEMTFIKNYLEIEEIRFQDRLQLNIELSQESLIGKVPSMLLQPLIENAIKHGISKITEKGEIQIVGEVTQSKQNSRLMLSVVNSIKPYNGAHHPAGLGIGQQNTFARLEQHYGRDFEFTFNAEASIYISTVDIPYTHD